MSEELIRLREIESAARDVLAYPAGSPRDVWNRLAVALGETALHADCGVCDEQSRLAEIGALVERLADGRCLSVEDSGGDWITASLVQIVDGREVELGDVQGEVGLLDALRSLAELEVSGE